VSPAFDVVIAGLGAMGSSTAFRLAEAGVRVLGLDRLRPPHAYGSSHGASRILREAYFEHPLYVPFAQRAIAAWREIEARSGGELLRTTGGLMLGPPEGEVVGGALRSARQHRLPHEVLSAREVEQRFPAFSVPDGEVGVWEPRAGILDPERSVEVMLRLARDFGAELRFGETLLGWVPDGDAVRVRTDAGEISCGRLVLCAGPWMPGLLGAAAPLAVERTVQHWFRPRVADGRFGAERCPVYIWESAPGRAWYGFPDLGQGVKAALHHQGEPADPETVRRSVGEDEIAAVARLLDRHLPGAAGQYLRSAVCMYTNTPDGHFVIDRHPRASGVWIVSPCSGHGFKFASAIGEVVAAEVRDQRSGFDLRPFRLARFAA
jgi:sarcosine oxidase